MINNEISEDYCSFEVSKLLKENGFKVGTREKYVSSNTEWLKAGEMFTPSDELDETGCENHGVPENKMIGAPTHALTIKWIRENFGWEILVEHLGLYSFKYIIKIPGNYANPIIGTNYNSNTGITDGYSSYEEATEAALLFTLQNLIH